MTKKKNTAIIVLLLLLLSLPISGAIDLKTLPATEIVTNSALLNGNITNLTNSTLVWFEYGNKPVVLHQETATQVRTTNTNFSIRITSMILFAGEKYYFRACSNRTECSEELNFTLNSISSFPTKNFGKHYIELRKSKFGMAKLAEVLPKTYTDMMLESRIFYGLFFGLIFMSIWIRTEDVVLPALLGMTIGASIFVFLPAEWMKLAQSLFIVSLSAAVYSLIKGRK